MIFKFKNIQLWCLQFKKNFPLKASELDFRIFFQFHFMLCFQGEIEATCPNLLRLGLLSEVGIDAATVREQSEWVSFHYKSLQEYSASKHVVKALGESSNIKVMQKNYT